MDSEGWHYSEDWRFWILSLFFCSFEPGNRKKNKVTLHTGNHSLKGTKKNKKYVHNRAKLFLNEVAPES